MKRILFLGEAVSLAHAARPFLLASSLDPSEYEVHFAVADRYPIFAGYEDRLRMRSLRSISPEDFLAALGAGRPIYSPETLHEYVKEDLAILDELCPEIVVGDFRLSLSVSAPLRQIHYVSITNAHWSPYSCRRCFPFPEHPLGKWVGVPLASRLFSLVQPIVLAQHAAPLNRVRKAYGLTPFSDLREAYTWADTVMYADVPELIPTRNLPANHYYIGPMIWSPEIARPDWWDQLPPREECVYLTLGSSGQVNALGAVLQGLAKLPVTVLLATAGRRLGAELPRNVKVAEYLPGTEAALRSGLVVCNGGSATVYQALAVGTPVLGIPSNLDQHLTMAAVREAGAGLAIRAEDATMERVRMLATEVLTDGAFVESALKVGSCFKAYPAPENFAHLIQRIVASGSAP